MAAWKENQCHQRVLKEIAFGEADVREQLCAQHFATSVALQLAGPTIVDLEGMGVAGIEAGTDKQPETALYDVSVVLCCRIHQHVDGTGQ